MVQIQILLGRADVEFRVPAEAIQFGDVSLRVDLRVRQRGHDRDLVRAVASQSMSSLGRLLTSFMVSRLTVMTRCRNSRG